MKSESGPAVMGHGDESNAKAPGRNVQITQGPFQGVRALVTRLITARERVEILIE
jgi:hypothetical protein